MLVVAQVIKQYLLCGAPYGHECTRVICFLLKNFGIEKTKKLIEEKDFVYVLREDLYNEWAWENGASNLICICDNLKTLEQKLKEQLVKEVEESDERILEFSSWKVGNMQSIGAMTKYAIDELYCGIDEIHILVYGNKEDYDNGKDNANIVISKVKIEK